MSFAGKTARSAAWTYLAYTLNKSSTFITTILLTHLILPAEYGIVAYAVTIVAFLDAVRDLGLGLALIQYPDDINDALDTAFWLNLGSNVIIWLASIALAPVAARFFNEPQLVSILPALCFSFILNSFGSIHDALLQRQMQFRKRLIPEVGSSLIKGILSVGLALIGYNAWALVVGQIAGRAVYSVMIWRTNSWRPKPFFYPSIARKLLKFGYKVAIDSFLSALQANIDYLFIGRFLGETTLALYSIAYRVPELVIINFCIVIATVLFPAYAELDDDSELKQAMLGAFRYISLITVPAGIGLALISPLFVKVFLAMEYAEAGPMMAVLSLYGMVLAVSWNIGDVYKALGRPDVLWKTALLEFAVLASVLFFAAQSSALAVAFSHLGVALSITLVRLVIVSRLLKIHIVTMLKQFVPSAGASIIMGIAVAIILVVTTMLTPLVSLFFAMFIGAVVYALVLYWIERDLAISILGKIEESFSIFTRRVKTSKN